MNSEVKQLNEIKDNSIKTEGYKEGHGADEWGKHKLNIAKGCINNCSYCLHPDTLVLMTNGTSKKIKNLEKNDLVWGITDLNNKKSHSSKFTPSRVLDIWVTYKNAIKITMTNGVELICSEDHRWLTERGWKYTIGEMTGINTRPYLTTNNSIRFLTNLYYPPLLSNDYKLGYLSGQIRGDALLKSFDYSKKRKRTGILYQFRLTQKDKEGMDRVFNYLNDFGVQTNWFKFKFKQNGEKKSYDGIRTSKKSNFDSIRSLIKLQHDNEDYMLGFLAGIFDAEGSFSCNILRISHCKLPETVEFLEESIKHFNFPFRKTKKQTKNVLLPTYTLTGRNEVFRFFQLTRPAIVRKMDLTRKSLRGKVLIKSIENLNETIEMVDITTSTENFIANGFVSHNCYGRRAAQFHRANSPEAKNWEGMYFNTRMLNVGFRKRDGRTMFPTTHDIVDFTDPQGYNILDESIKTLKKLLVAGNDVLIVSKPSIEVTERLIDELKEYKEQILFRFTITTTDKQLLAKYEPNTPSLSERLHSLGLAKEAGFKTSVSIEPFLSDPIPTIEMVRLLVTDTIWIGPMSNPLAELKELYTYKNLSQIYDRLTHHPAASMIRLKDSYRKKLGIKEDEKR